MPSEYVGTCGHGRLPDREAVAAELDFGIACLRRYCGPEPSGCSLEIVWHDHDSGAYPTISLVWAHGSLSPEHWHYIERCGAALDRLNGCVDWDALTVMRSDSKGTPVSIVDSWIVPAFCGLCGGLWLTLIISQPSLWWVPLMLMADHYLASMGLLVRNKVAADSQRISGLGARCRTAQDVAQKSIPRVVDALHRRPISALVV